ncbi:sn-glycerol-3-phosphate ABC transporter ATP-binding protein UgpC [Brevundimonas sp. BAL450]|uniref:Maltose/maltodextrin transport ATP-binding protein malK n=2 Tax=Brevundimonas TaxID=41275 RepID=A0A8E0KKF5_9CAUL|nr:MULTISPECIES: sn-glycerol-3-phosphate ABC transporter ATP-binding protein UgpC [Brevundimonas]MBG7614071.1 sn-glycerol-3-phosphate ABC transporter ATP-binding protein UgpC [Brevundimonas sp. BAL450]GAD58729.1 maltose/maltodextrin transport ATP-binding protein malK [Brevundimonas abyssalis TAR-001]
MANVTLEGVRKNFGATEVIRGVDLTIEDGEFVVFVGPSGCGKSTLLRLIAGLEDLTGGDVLIGDRNVSGEAPADRGIAMVFQSYALYPHMTVRQNMGFGLKLAKTDKAEVDRRVNAAAEVLTITDLLDRKPKQLSGGQRQRVAIGRAIVREPQVFLFDEPLSNLDAALRVRMRYEFARLHGELKTTMIYVTHDQVEAMTLADRIVVLSAGRIEQVGAPMDLYEHPDNLFVAGFIGSPRMNFLTAEVVEASAGGAMVRTAAGEALTVAVDAARAKPGDPVTLGVRPEHLTLTGGDNALTARADFVETLGHATYAYLAHDAAADGITCQLPGDVRPKAGEALTVHVPRAQAHLFDADGQAFQRLA